MTNEKAPGSDGVTADMLKVEDTVTPRLLTQIFSDIWETENTPDWKMGLIVKLHKKGDLSNSNTWRGITLLSLTSKVFSKIIQERLIKALEQNIREEQAGRKGKSCSDHIYTLRQILEQSNEWNRPLYANFIYFENVF